MRPRHLASLGVVLLVLAAGAHAAETAADLVLRGGAVYTMNAARSWAEAVAIRGESIVFVGADRDAAAWIGPATRVIDLGGKMVLPGFQDAHVHPIDAGMKRLGCYLYDLKTKDEYVAAVRRCAAERPDATWVRGSGWALPAFAPTGIPDRKLLDAAVPDRPVYLSSLDGHSAWVNSKALAAAGITKKTPDPPGGRIDRDPSTGQPVGSLQDAAMELVAQHLPPHTAADRLDGLRGALKTLNAFGVTSFQEASASADELETYRKLDDEGGLTARVVAAMTWDPELGDDAQLEALRAARETHTKGRVRATTVKIFEDGVMEVQTAALLEPYAGKPGERGLTLIEPGKLKRIVTKLDRERFQVHFHAIGDAAIRHCLDAVEAARQANGARDARHHVAHVQLWSPSDIPRIRALGMAANFQPLWAYADDYITDLTLPFLEPARQRWLYPIRSLHESGAVVAFGSDWPVSTANPLEELEVAVTRISPSGGASEKPAAREAFIPEERIALPEALAAFTIGAAWVNFQDDRTGSIEAGKLADLVVLDRNLFEIPASAISEARVLLTLLGGRPVHAAAPFEKLAP